MPEHSPAPTPSRALYGLVLYLFSNAAFWIYCIWAFTPDYYLHMFNIYYYPQKYWATAVPIQCLVALTFFVFFIYPTSNMMLTADIDSTDTIVDSYSLKNNKNMLNGKSSISSCICLDVSKCGRVGYNSEPEYEERKVSQLYDLDIRYVNKILYFNKNKINTK